MTYLNVNSNNDIKKLSDLEIIARFKSTGDNSYIGVLFERYTHLVFGVCMKYLRDEDDSKDAVMQIFEKLLKELQRHEIEYFKAWLHTVAKNHCLMKLRSKPKEISGMDHLFVENGSYEHPAGVGIDPAVEKENSLSKMEDAIQLLDPKQKICIELFYLKEMSYQQVSDLTGYDLNQVKSYIQNGKRNLKIILSNHEES